MKSKLPQRNSYLANLLEDIRNYYLLRKDSLVTELLFKFLRYKTIGGGARRRLFRRVEIRRPVH